MKVKEEKAITLIALIITIIILLILVGISIATLTGENGILKKASSVGEQTKIAEYKEILIMIGNGLRSEKILEDLSTKEYMGRYQEAIEKEIQKGDTFESSKAKRKNEGTIIVTTKEGYIYVVTEDEVKFLGKKGETTPPDLQESDIEFKLASNGYTNTDIEVEIIARIELGNNKLQYSTDGTNWIDYTEKIIIKENGTIYARLINVLEETGGSATKDINTIDKELPNEATIQFNVYEILEGNNVIATINQSDRGTSGVDITKCKWIYTTNRSSIGTNEASYTGGMFSRSPQDLTLSATTPGTYYLHILTMDKAGNKTESISKAIVVKKMPTVEEVEQGKYVNYVLPNGNTIKCAVLWDANSTYGKNGVQIIAMNTVKNVEIGYSSNSWTNCTNSWNNGIKTLNDASKEFINYTYATGARCVGSNPENFYAQSSKYSNYGSAWPAIIQDDTNYAADWAQMMSLKIQNIGINYWMASRTIGDYRFNGNYPNQRWYCFRIVNSSGNLLGAVADTHIMSAGIYGVADESPNFIVLRSYGLRPIFILKNNIKLNGTGTSDSPYTLTF